MVKYKNTGKIIPIYPLTYNLSQNVIRQIIENGLKLALANKETVVMAYPLIKALSEKTGSAIIPVDSEHSAIFNLVERIGKQNIQKIYTVCTNTLLTMFYLSDIMIM